MTHGIKQHSGDLLAMLERFFVDSPSLVAREPVA
jgi:hypothetical protein